MDVGAGTYLESRVTCGGEEVGALTDDGAMDLVNIASAADRQVRVFCRAKEATQAAEKGTFMDAPHISQYGNFLIFFGRSFAAENLYFVKWRNEKEVIKITRKDYIYMNHVYYCTSIRVHDV